MIPRAHVLANVTTEEPFSHAGSQFCWHVIAQLDRQVTDAAARIQNVRIDERAGRTGIETRSAGTAVVGLVRGVVFQFQVGKQGRQKKPTAQLLVQEQRVLADPTQAGELCELAFQQRRRINHAAHFGLRGRASQPFDKLLQTRTDHVVVICPPSVSRHPPLPRLGRLGLRSSIIHC